LARSGLGRAGRRGRRALAGAQAASEPVAASASSPALAQEPRRAAGRSLAALGGVGDHQPVLGAGRGHVEQTALLAQRLGVGGGQRLPGWEHLLLAAQQEHERRLGALGAVDGRHGHAPVLAGPELLDVQADRVLEEVAQRRLGCVLLLERLGGAAQRAEILEYPLSVAAGAGAGRGVASLLVVADETAIEHHGREHHVAERAASLDLSPHRAQTLAE
jgi:hypothetical protein